MSMAARNCRYPHYEDEDCRFKSYKHWPVSLPTRPRELAEAGFFYTGLGDHTQCFFCGGGLKMWEPGADPWEQHARWYDCAFVVEKRKENYVRRVLKRWSKTKEKINGPSRSDKKPESRRTCYPCHARGVGGTKSSYYFMAAQNCRYPHYEDEDCRFKSYKHWPVSLPTRPRELAEAGFFYTGLGDHTQCFFCGGGLKMREPGADPWEQHARWYVCAFVVEHKKEAYVRGVVERWCGYKKKLTTDTYLKN